MTCRWGFELFVDIDPDCDVWEFLVGWSGTRIGTNAAPPTSAL